MRFRFPKGEKDPFEHNSPQTPEGFRLRFPLNGADRSRTAPCSPSDPAAVKKNSKGPQAE